MSATRLAACWHNERGQGSPLLVVGGGGGGLASADVGGAGGALGASGGTGGGDVGGAGGTAAGAGGGAASLAGAGGGVNAGGTSASGGSGGTGNGVLGGGGGGAGPFTLPANGGNAPGGGTGGTGNGPGGAGNTTGGNGGPSTGNVVTTGGGGGGGLGFAGGGGGYQDDGGGGGGYGGGGGGFGPDAAGGGGSSHVFAAGATNVSSALSARTGDGKVSISYDPVDDACPVQSVSLGSAKVWLGLKNTDDVGTRFDVQAEILQNGSTLVGSGTTSNVAPTGSSFAKALSKTFALALNGSPVVNSGDSFGIRVSVRIACGVSGHASGTARLLYQAGADSNFGATIGGNARTFYLRSGNTLASSAGTPIQTADVLVKNTVACSGSGRPYTAIGTWTTTLP